MNSGNISQETFNRVCRLIQNANVIHPKNEICDLLASNISLQDEALMDILEKVLFYAATVADKKHVVYADTVNFAAYFRELWLQVLPNQGEREQYAQAIQSFIDKGIMTELFWSEDFSVVRFCNNAFGMFFCVSDNGYWSGAILDESVLTSVVAEYVKCPAAYRQYSILDEAGLGLKHFGDLDKVLHPEYTERVMVYSSLAECEVETIIHPNIGPLYMPGIRIVPGYNERDFGDVIRSVIAYNMKEDQKTAAYAYLKLKDALLSNSTTKTVLSRESIRFTEQSGKLIVVEQLSDMKWIGQYHDSGGEQLVQLQAKYHRIELEQAARIKAQQEKAARIEAYWSAHLGEKEALEEEEKQCREHLSSLSERLRQYYQERQRIENNYAKEQHSEVDRLSTEIHLLSNSIYDISLLHRKKRKELQGRIEQLKAERKAIEEKQESEELSLLTCKENKLRKLDASWKNDLERKKQLDQRLSAILAEMAKDR